MSALKASAHSLRAVRMRARAPRALLYLLVGILCVGGLRAILRPNPAAVPPQRTAAQPPDVAAQTFAESFAREYMSWNARDPDARDRQLGVFLSDQVDSSAGLTPGRGTSQRVLWTGVAGTKHMTGRLLVTVAVQTDHGLSYLAVPVARNAHGFLSLAGYPAIVGPPAIQRADLQQDDGTNTVEDDGLSTVAQRAITNYLAGGRPNLMADLAPGAVVSPPTKPMRLTQTGDVTWVQPGHRVAIQVVARDAAGTAWTLGYELDVVKRDRWYVRSIEVDPTTPGGQP